MIADFSLRPTAPLALCHHPATRVPFPGRAPEPRAAGGSLRLVFLNTNTDKNGNYKYYFCLFFSNDYAN